MDKYIVVKTQVYKIAAASREEAMAAVNKYTPTSESVECYAVELDFGSDCGTRRGK